MLPSALVTIRVDGGFAMGDVLQRWEDNPQLLHGSDALVHGLLDAVVDSHITAIQRIDDVLETMEDVLFDEATTNREFVRRMYDVRKDLVGLRRVTLPMRQVVNGLLRHGQVHADLEPWVDDLYDHVLRASEWSESLRDLVTSMFEANLTLQDSRLNQIMKKLAAWAALIAVPTALTGWSGRTCPIPGSPNRGGCG